MQNPLQVTYHDLMHNQELEKVIQEKFAKVNKEIANVTKCHVVFEKLSKHHQKANMACVRLDLKISHFEDIVVTDKCTEEIASLKSAVIKVFKQGLDIAHKNKKRRLENKRQPVGEFKVEESVEVED